MELRQLKYFTVLAEELSFSRAAQKLFITQGTLSQQIKQLEGEIGADLFERSSHNVALTECGSELLQYARGTLDAAHECIQVAGDLRKGVRGTLNIGVTHSFKYLLRSTVKEFIKQYPGVKMNICYSTATDLLTMLRERKIDFFVAFKPAAQYADIESVPLFSSRLAVIMRRGHPLSDKKSLTMEELRRHPLALPAGELQSRKVFERFVDLDTANMKVSLEINDPNILLEIVSATNLLGITSTLAISYRNDLVAIPLEGAERQMQGCVHRLSGAYVKRSADIFTQMLVESAEIERIGMD